MGILNLTPDSFSDGGLHGDVAGALEHARQMIADAADIIDVGGESTRPGAVPVGEEEELARVLPVVSALAHDLESSACKVLISIDTRHASVAEVCVEAGARIINDISGFRDPEMRRVAVEAAERYPELRIVVMHMQGEPDSMQDAPVYSEAGVVADVASYLKGQAALLEAEGLPRERIILDPGPGFGKTLEQTISLMEGLSSIIELGYPVLWAPSRKSFVGVLYGQEIPAERLWSSVAVALRGVEAGAAGLRVHDVAETQEALDALQLAPRRVYVAMGCNSVPDRLEALRQALAELEKLPFTQVVAVSKAYSSEPAYYEEQADFANAVAQLRTALHPRVLLQELQGLEWRAGRRRSFRNAPRPLDLDILDYEGLVSQDPALSLPHPRIAERDFVVTPLLEIAPDCVLADGSPVNREQLRYGRVSGVLGDLR